MVIAQCFMRIEHEDSVSGGMQPADLWSDETELSQAQLFGVRLSVWQPSNSNSSQTA